MILIQQYKETDRDPIIELVLHCQNDGSRPLVGVEDQPDLLHIQEKYLNSGGGFWVAKHDGQVIGSIGLVNCNNGTGILKKFFVREGYRGKPHHLGLRLYTQLLTFAKECQLRELVLDTPKNTDRAHHFYLQAGFSKISREELPIQYDQPYKDCDFFLLKLC